MDGRTHAALGAATALVVIRPTKPEDLIATAAVGAFAGILPDVDISGSKVSRVIRSIIGGFISIVAFFIIQAQVTGTTVIDSINKSGFATNIIGLAILIAFSFYGASQPHRGFTHSFVAAAIASFSAYLIFAKLLPAFIVGYLSHLGIDYFNKKGEQFLWPLEDRRCLGLCTANGVAALSTRMVSYFVCIGYAAYLGLS